MPPLGLAAPHPCKHHRDRPGYGQCRRCKAVLCVQCASFVDQIITCAGCVAALAREEEGVLVAVGDTPRAHALALALGVCGSMVALYAVTLLYT